MSDSQDYNEKIKYLNQNDNHLSHSANVNRNRMGNDGNFQDRKQHVMQTHHIFLALQTNI